VFLFNQTIKVSGPTNGWSRCALYHPSGQLIFTDTNIPENAWGEGDLETKKK
jgi:hypothetical protein